MINRHYEAISKGWYNADQLGIGYNIYSDQDGGRLTINKDNAWTYLNITDGHDLTIEGGDLNPLPTPDQGKIMVLNKKIKLIEDRLAKLELHNNASNRMR